jgi:hypothetical protein
MKQSVISIQANGFSFQPKKSVLYFKPTYPASEWPRVPTPDSEHHTVPLVKTRIRHLESDLTVSRLFFTKHCTIHGIFWRTPQMGDVVQEYSIPFPCALHFFCRFLST